MDRLGRYALHQNHVFLYKRRGTQGCFLIPLSRAHCCITRSLDSPFDLPQNKTWLLIGECSTPYMLTTPYSLPLLLDKLYSMGRWNLSKSSSIQPHATKKQLLPPSCVSAKPPANGRSLSSIQMSSSAPIPPRRDSNACSRCLPLPRLVVL